MKDDIGALLLAITLVFMIGCELDDNKGITRTYKLPEEDRYIYDMGDTLVYRCSDGSFDSVLVKVADFWTISGNSANFFGGTTKYTADGCQISVEHFNDHWNNILIEDLEAYDSLNVYNRCFTILLLADYHTNYPYTEISNSCIRHEGFYIAAGEVKFKELVINSRTYQKVYHEAIHGYEIYWNLKFGIIRIEYTQDGRAMVLDLKEKV